MTEPKTLKAVAAIYAFVVAIVAAIYLSYGVTLLWKLALADAPGEMTVVLASLMLWSPLVLIGIAIIAVGVSSRTTRPETEPEPEPLDAPTWIGWFFLGVVGSLIAVAILFAVLWLASLA